MKILVSGGAGTVGSRLVRGLVEKGHRVRALILPGDLLRSRLDGVDCDVVEGDITQKDSLAGVFDGMDTVYHLAAVILSHDPAVFVRVNVQGTRHMLEGAERAGVGHFVYVSSASVVYPHSTPYSRSKRACESMVSSRDRMSYTIVRPTLVYEKDGGQEFLLFLDYLKKFPLVPFIGDGRALKNPVHADDLMDGLLRLAGCQAAHDKTYDFCGGEEISMRELSHLMLKHKGMDKPFVHLPVAWCKLIAHGFSLFTRTPPLTLSAIAGITQDANLDCSTARRDLGYNPVGVREGFSRCFPLTIAS
ncbi:MAG: NAD-dependent epimerase/dehydratase family protein [Deltaproteobacteria bacterium]|nr:NAD-dependent epimerase/dehydratase family protein [Deltaproteobacteria bacterium]